MYIYIVYWRFFFKVKFSPQSTILGCIKKNFSTDYIEKWQQWLKQVNKIVFNPQSTILRYIVFNTNILTNYIEKWQLSSSNIDIFSSDHNQQYWGVNTKVLNRLYWEVIAYSNPLVEFKSQATILKYWVQFLTNYKSMKSLDEI